MSPGAGGASSFTSLHRPPSIHGPSGARWSSNPFEQHAAGGRPWPTCASSLFWGGRLAFFRDALPRVGAAGPYLFFALGFGGHGLTMATFGGALAAEMIVGESPGRAPFDLPIPFEWLGRPGANSLRLLSWLYRALDALD